MNSTIEENTLTLEESEAELRTILRSSGDGIVSINEKNIIILANSQLEEMWGYSLGELLGKPIQILMPLHYRKDHTLGVRNFIMENKHDTSGQWNDVEGLHKDGYEFPVWIRIARVQHEGRFLLAAIVRDARPYQQLRASTMTALSQARENGDNTVLIAQLERLVQEIEQLNLASEHLAGAQKPV